MVADLRRLLYLLFLMRKYIQLVPFFFRIKTSISFNFNVYVECLCYVGNGRIMRGISVDDLNLAFHSPFVVVHRGNHRQQFVREEFMV